MLAASVWQFLAEPVLCAVREDQLTFRTRWLRLRTLPLSDVELVRAMGWTPLAPAAVRILTDRRRFSVPYFDVDGREIALTAFRRRGIKVVSEHEEIEV